MILVIQVLHIFVKFIQEPIPQQAIMDKMPLSSRMMVTVTVSLPWKIKPFWMAEFIPHEVEIAFTTESHSNKPLRRRNKWGIHRFFFIRKWLIRKQCSTARKLRKFNTGLLRPKKVDKFIYRRKEVIIT